MNRFDEYRAGNQSRADRAAQPEQRSAVGSRNELPYDISDEDYAPLQFGFEDANEPGIFYDDGGIPGDQREHRRFADRGNDHMRFGAASEPGRYLGGPEFGNDYSEGSSFPGMERFSPERASSTPNRTQHARLPAAVDGTRESRAGRDGVRYRNERETSYRYPRDAPRTDDYGEGDDHFATRQRRAHAGFGSLYGSPSQDASGDGTRGDFSGLGPKNYVRSDDRIREDVSERLCDDAAVDASDITVDVRNGKVTLSGQVSDRATKHRVEDLVDRCNGVVEIENRLGVTASKRY